MKQIFTFIFSFILVSVIAQEKIGRVSGNLNSAEGKNIESATVSLLRAKDSALVKVAVSNKQGNFDFEKIATGNYFVSVNAVGFAPKYSASFNVGAEAVVVPALQLNAATNKLGEVSVTAKRPLIENKIDKMVVNVDASPTNSGLSALEVIEKSPGVMVDNDGNISIKGKSGVIVLLDGKPAYLSGQDLANYLKNLPANQLDQLEIMTQPPARFDASGNSGVINIKTKKSKADGFNGSFSTSLIFANYFKETNSLNFNWRKNKVNVYGNYGYAYWEGFNEINIDRKNKDASSKDFTQIFEQSTFGKFKGQPHNFKLGIDYFANKKTTLGAIFSGLVDKRQFTSEGNSNIMNGAGVLVARNVALSQNKDPWTNVGTNLNLRQLLGTKGAELTMDADYILYRTKGNQYSNNYTYNANGTAKGDPYLLKGYLPADIDIYSFKADYSIPLKKESRFEAGVKSSYVQTDNDAQYTFFNKTANNWDKDLNRSNHFLYKENINAGYVNLQKQFKKFGIQLGLRVEQTHVEGNQLANHKTFDSSYVKVFPTSYFSYKLNENNTLGLSYGRRIERPSYQDLNPFQYLLDQYTYRQGNPALRPQFSHNIELSYNYKGALNVSANYTKTTDIINDILRSFRTSSTDTTFTTYQTKENLADRRNIGLSINFQKPIMKWWNLNLFTSIYNNAYDGNIPTNKNGVITNEPVKLDITAYMFNITNSFNFQKGWTGELSGFFQSENLVSGVIVARPMGMFALGGGKTILKNKGTLRMNIRDPFWLQKFRGYTELETLSTQIRSKWDNRRFIFTFNYRFGKTANQQAQPRRRNSGAQDEANRVNLGTQQ
jgi:outer membrane receptor protein involved in Fe transport